MPIVNINLIEGRSVEQKRALVESVTKAICESVDVTPDHVRIILQDMARHDYAVAGQLNCDKK
ncbi:MAG: 4-oxalocrotonate tautomerase [Alphaproteobacteria bacterium CG11_big_fil_rev_8_21_14_0_20_44_7]|nr:MAG: 4-oxalocrotonate tautomerase [Alphaproteobacteria bacterium CG11_big_fil_rev_8_21_14_0_20_44_7]